MNNKTNDLNLTNRFEYVKEIQKELKLSYPSDNGLKIPEILMLNFSHKYKVDNNNFQQFWYYEYGIDNPQELLTSLADRNFISIATAENSLINLKLNELKNLLKELGLKTNGKKEELISRIVNNSDDEWLDKKVNERNYELTEIGEKEIKQNEYVLYFHKIKFKYGMSVWWMNQQLHKYPKKPFRDIMWEEFNKRIVEAMKRIEIGDYSSYIRTKSQMCDFLFEENKFETALAILTEITYLDINVYLKSYFKNREFNEYSRSTENDIFNIKRFEVIKTKTNCSDNEFFKKLNSFFERYNVKKSIISGMDLSGIILLLINKDYDKTDYIFNWLKNELN